MFDASVADDLMPADMAISQAAVLDGAVRLGRGAVGLSGRVVSVCPPSPGMEQILLEMGFVEGAEVEILHQGPFGGDPIAVRVDGMRVALRRADAATILVLPPPLPAQMAVEPACD